MPRSYQVTPAGPSHLMPTKQMNANPNGGTEPMSQTPGDQDPTTATRGEFTLTLRGDPIDWWQTMRKLS
jgi:hypothetical protein